MARHPPHPSLLPRKQAYEQVRLLERPHPQHDRLSLPLVHPHQSIPASGCPLLRTVLTEWNNPSAYYQAAPANYYAAFWHRHSINALA